MNYRLFATRYLLLFLAVFALIGGCNWFVDPYDIFGSPAISGVNRLKPEVANHLRLTKAYAVRQYRAGSVILGSSRAERGLDPEHPGWGETARPVYNLAFAAANVYEALRYLQHAQAERPLRRVIIGLDFFMFNAKSVPKPGFVDERLGSETAAVPFSYRVHDKLQTIFSLDTLKSSCATVVGNQGKSAAKLYLPNGQVSWDYGREKLRSIGCRQAFLETDRILLDGYTFSMTDAAGNSTMRHLTEILRTARRHSIDLQLFISPDHARMLETVDLAGLWPQYEEWKRSLVRAVEAEAAEHPGSAPYPLWDFSGFTVITTEAVPAADDRTSEMHYYWDSSHYTKETGDLILSCMFAAAGDRYPGFGVLLNSGNLETHLAAITASRDDYRRSHGADRRELLALQRALSLQKALVH